MVSEVKLKTEKVTDSQAFEGQMLVSIIVPSFNVEKFIAEALESVISQQYKNWECIIVDDHSADQTEAVVLDFISQYPEKIRLYKNPGKGACAARNFGLTLAKGECIKFLDSDDALFDENTLKTQVSYLQGNNLDIVFGVEHYFQEKFDPANLVKKRGADLNDKNVNLQFFTRFPITSNFLLRSVDNSDLKWSLNLKSGQEFHFLFTCLIKGLRFGFQDIPTAKIRIHNSVHRISNKTPEVYVKQTFDLINHLGQDLEIYRYSNEDFLSAFNVWKLRWSFSALRVKNFQVFKSIQSQLLSPSNVKVGNAEVRVLYRLNALSPYLAFACYEIFRKATKRDVLRESLQ